ncbi:hypothetical protein GUJ93_ZPchr0005g15987 [Zizania palustris]|uniref:Uncharacterized protein n=1 Tax=Zizania palustris TaxID=103762 RepID=A0A8J5SSN9_ZIZPA|nr:hypothetical protein GUJ93_ZPchr0005g15987 [Zizania palustris]
MEINQQAQLLPPVQSPHRVQEPSDPQGERTTAFGKEVIGITSSAIIAGVSGYKDIAKVASLQLFKAAGFSLLITFASAVIMTQFQMHLPPGARHNRCADLSSAILVFLTSVLLIATSGTCVVLMNKDNTVLLILVLPVVLVLGMLADADSPPGDAAKGTAGQDEAYEEAMERNAELASFGATVAFATEGALILGYLKYPSLDGGCYSQVDLAVSFFASTVSVVAMAITALPVRTLFPSAQARLVVVIGRLNRAMLGALISMAMVLAVEFLQWWFILSLLPEAIVGTLNVAIMGFMAWSGDGEGSVASHGGGSVDGGDEAAVTRERMAKVFKTVATISFTLMACTYAVYLGHNKHDVYLRSAMVVMLAAILSSLRQMLRPFPFELDLPRATGWWPVAVGAVSLVFPGLALLIAVPLLVKISVHFYFDHVN